MISLLWIKKFEPRTRLDVATPGSRLFPKRRRPATRGSASFILVVYMVVSRFVAGEAPKDSAVVGYDFLPLHLFVRVRFSVYNLNALA